MNQLEGLGLQDRMVSWQRVNMIWLRLLMLRQSLQRLVLMMVVKLTTYLA